jgi:2-oxoglutarate dehydrogenase E2 component (dihydrolipoamide succinyltransferase)
VAADEPLVEVESEKATWRCGAFGGRPEALLKPSGATVNVGEVIGELEQGAGAATSAAAAIPAPAAIPALAASASPAAIATPASTPATAPTSRTDGRARLPPSVRRLLAEHGLTRQDVLRALSAPAPTPLGTPGPAPRPPGPDERLVPMTPLRRTVARRLVEAQRTAAILTTFNEVDMSRVLALRDRHGAAFQEKHGVKLGFLSFFVKACVEGLRAFPSLNAEVRGDAILFKDHYDIGVAVGGGKGLVVPVVRGADRLPFGEIEARIGELAKMARENRITLDDLEGGTFTISNGGVYGSLLSTPILNLPQSGILGMHKIEKRAVAGPGDSVVVRPMMYLALSYDHRIVDGREAVSFLVRVKECIEDPERLLLEV